MRVAWRALIAASGCFLGSIAGCGSPLNAPGTGCTIDGDCAAGLSCLAVASAPGADCRNLLNVCSKTCRADGDCVAVAPDFKCIPTCNGGGTCGHTR